MPSSSTSGWPGRDPQNRQFHRPEALYGLGYTEEEIISGFIAILEDG